jgi:hypothetical protein
MSIGNEPRPLTTICLQRQAALHLAIARYRAAEQMSSPVKQWMTRSSCVSMQTQNGSPSPDVG